jgi:hypothetical protein
MGVAMVRYEIEVRVLNSYFELMTKLPLTIEADHASDDEGTWSVPKWASTYFGVTRGDWTLEDYDKPRPLEGTRPLGRRNPEHVRAFLA